MRNVVQYSVVKETSCLLIGLLIPLNIGWDVGHEESNGDTTGLLYYLAATLTSENGAMQRAAHKKALGIDAVIIRCCVKVTWCTGVIAVLVQSNETIR